MAFKPIIKIRIVDFYTKAREKTEGKLALGDDGKPIYDDWCAYSSIGSQDIVAAPIRNLCRVTDAYPNNPAFQIALARWEYIKPAYEAWKRGEEAPEVGTPLSAGNFFRKEDVMELRRHGVRSIEEFIELPEGARDRMRLPRAVALQKEAKAFLEAQDANKAAADLAARDEQIKALEERLKALEDAPNQPQPPYTAEPEKRGPGRPPKGI